MFYTKPKKTKKLLLIEKQILRLILKTGDSMLKGNSIFNSVSDVDREKYKDLLSKYFDELEKILYPFAKNKFLFNREKGKEIKYFVWYEDFVDEDSGEVFSVKRTTVVRINGILLDNHKPIKFNPKNIFDGKLY